MSKLMHKALPALAGSAAFSALALGQANPAAAQQVGIPAIVPLNDASCNLAGVYSTVAQVPPCFVDGTRQVTLTDVTRSPITATADRVVATYNVNFDGNLRVDGAPIVLQSGPTFAPSFPAVDVFGVAGSPVVEVSGSYTATRSARLPKTAPTSAFPTVGQWAYFGAITSSDLTVRSISVDSAASVDGLDGSTYDFTLRSIDPRAIVNNGTALSGVFHGQSGTGAIQFGTLSGTATLVIDPPAIPFTSNYGGNLYGYISNFGLQYDVAATLLTQLDETGLIAPRVEVTGGVEMNGSQVTGVADGIAATDGINKGQLDAEASARVAADAVVLASIQAEAAQRAAEDTAIRSDLAAEAQARAAVDAQVEQRILAEETARAALSQALVNESSARLASDLALNSQVTALGSRVDALEAQVGFLDRRLARSTAMAVAMSGSVFLPGMRYNVSANFGTYDGENAGALQLAALVSDNVAFNAGIATGFEGGGTSVRAGLTFAF